MGRLTVLRATTGGAAASFTANSSGISTTRLHGLDIRIGQVVQSITEHTSFNMNNIQLNVLDKIQNACLELCR